MNEITTNLQDAKDYSSSIKSTSTNFVVSPFMDYTIQQANSNNRNSQVYNELQQLDKNFHQTNQEQQKTSTSFAKSYLNKRFNSSSCSSSGDSCEQLRNVINQSNHNFITPSPSITNNLQAPIASIHRLSSASFSNCTSNSDGNVKSNNKKSHQSTASSFANTMIAKLSSGSSLTARAPSAQSKRKRSKLLDILLNSNWSKQNQQASNILKLNKVLLVCDANFLDEKTGESPISLAINSSQINNSNSTSSTSLLVTNNQQASSHFGSLTSSNPIISCPPQSASLFNLTAQSTGKGPITRHALQQTNISDLSQSKAPLIERILLLLVKSGAQIDFRNSDGKTPLHVAAMKSNFWALKTLLELEASTDYRDINGLTPLYYSILHKADLKVTQLLLNYQNRNLSNYGVALTTNSIQASQTSRKPAIGITDQHGWQEVHQACKLGLDAHLEKLLYYGCDINGKISGSGNTPLHVAAINDQLNCAKVLLMRGADKTITNNSHQTAHQVAVISNNMDLAEFIAEHNESKVIPFRERPANFVDMSCRSSFSMISSSSPSSTTTTPPITTTVANSTNVSQRSSTRSSLLANSYSWISNNGSNQQPRATVLPQLQQPQHMNPLSLDVSSQANFSNSSSGFKPQSLLSISGNINNHQLNVQVNNISPCLSQRSCATSNTTSSSGVCCDGDGNNSAEEQQQSKFSNSLSQHSNITIIAINKNDKSQPVVNGRKTVDGIVVNGEIEDDEDLRSSGSSSNDLYSLMSDERPLFAGTIVEATSDYQSGDPNHLRLRRGDLIEVLEYTQELLQAGQLPRLANKPMLYGRQKSDGLNGLFPSFCVQRAKHQKTSVARQRLPLTDVPNPNTINSNMPTLVGLQNGAQNIRGTNLPESNSMATLNHPQMVDASSDDPFNLKSKFREIQVTLTKTNEGFGFVLRGAKVDPSTFTANGCQKNKVIIDEKLMAANNLVSLQYLDEIEQDSVASRAGLNKGDFLVAVNHQDVCLKSHEQVVQMIRQSGDQVHFTIATPLVSGQMTQKQQQQKYQQTNLSKTSGKVKPDPPKRDPTTTLTRNRAQKVRSMLIQPILQQQQQQHSENFDANKPLPIAPSTESSMSPTGSLNIMNRSISTNLSHFNSAQSLSSVANTQSISSVSTIGADEQAQQQNQSEQPTPTHSSSSTATLTTVAATSIKPKAPPKPAGVQLNHSGNQSTGLHQPAVIQTTTRRISQPGNQENSSPTSSNATITPPSPQASSFPLPTAAPPPPPPPPPPLPPTLLAPVVPVTHQEPTQTTISSTSPPPPPPLPDFSASPMGPRMNQRRTSAPIIQTSPIIVDNNRLLKKRESLAVVNQVDRAQAPVPAQFGAVAAACAAAANNRLQRQQRQKLEEEIGKAENENNADSTYKTVPTVTKAPEEHIIESKLSADGAQGLQTLISKESPLKEPSIGGLHQLTRPLDRKQMSATLGRKSSAQIIQQPKTQQSQTLRGSKHNRASILPPPLLSNSDEADVNVQRYQATKLAPAYPYHHHHHNHHSTEIPTINQEYNQQQQMQSLALHQQQVIKQQLHQQQQQQQQQQQLLLQQHVQFQQRLCLGGKHNHDHYGHVVDSTMAARGHHSHENRHQQPIIQQQIRGSQALPLPQHQHQHQHHHHHHHHQQQQQSHHHNYHSHHPHHSHHEKLLTGVTQQQYHQHQHHHHQQQHSNSIVHQQENLHQQPAMHNHSNHNYIANQSQQQQLYQRLQQQQQLAERYLPVVYSNDAYATATRDS